MSEALTADDRATTWHIVIDLIGPHNELVGQRAPIAYADADRDLLLEALHDYQPADVVLNAGFMTIRLAVPAERMVDAVTVAIEAIVRALGSADPPRLPRQIELQRVVRSQ